jgi:hypothetical protein
MAWIIMLAISLLPNVILQEFFGIFAGFYLLVIKSGLLAALIAAGFIWPWLVRFRPFMIILLVFYLAEYALFSMGNAAWWPAWMGGEALFAGQMFGIQIRKTVVAFAIIAMLLIMGYRRNDFYLVRGQLDAPIEPVRLLGFTRPEPWTRFGGMWAVFITLGTLTFLVIAGRPSSEALIAVIPLIPLILLLAAMNAFSEEVSFRASLLGTLREVIHPRQALWLTAVFFGLAHYYGIPYGIIGVLMSTFLGWMLSKSMLETRGFFWAWFIHFLQDIVIFFFLAAGAVMPSGG